jgi:hypothetical protein
LTFTLISTPLLVSRSEALPTLLPAPSLICACAWFYTMAFAASYVIAVLFVLVVAANDDDKVDFILFLKGVTTSVPGFGFGFDFRCRNYLWFVFFH